jgi:hypothetical protein
VVVELEEAVVEAEAAVAAESVLEELPLQLQHIQ